MEFKVVGLRLHSSLHSKVAAIFVLFISKVHVFILLQHKAPLTLDDFQLLLLPHLLIPFLRFYHLSIYLGFLQFLLDHKFMVGLLSFHWRGKSVILGLFLMLMVEQVVNRRLR
mmetsp:Transcript_9851/g.9712  ORF Transcript_9851/g.9712 Transcript_9851/m.9712 type:complete len:113 (-) Transcript_9851:3493-3831(-)